MYRLWPDPDPNPIDDDTLVALYQPAGPGLRMNFVTSVDGAVEIEGRSAGLGNPADKLVFGLLRQYPDGLLVGAGTLRREASEAPVRPIVLTCRNAPPDRVTALSTMADVLAHGDDEVDLRAAFADLRERGIGTVLCEGGPHLFGSLTAADLVDEMCLTVSPLLAGPGAGRITAGSPSPVRDLRLAHALYAEDAILLRYARG
ncbi:MAG: hypothetical protein AUI14_05880 [Actinobacteria bacterium 13_2_20CM_2_71_6]|nr:MAG: hypothetical protein AUI14_05880 [Actinobacteria bacterium 13_2_20CM_2_71_6]